MSSYTEEQFRNELSKADAIRVDGGPLLENWETDDNELLMAKWEEDDLEYTVEIIADAVISMAKQKKQIIIETKDNGHYKIEMYRLLDINQDIWTVIYKENGIIDPDKIKSFCNIEAAKAYYRQILSDKEVENKDSLVENLQDWFDYNGNEISIIVTSLQ